MAHTGATHGDEESGVKEIESTDLTGFLATNSFTDRAHAYLDSLPKATVTAQFDNSEGRLLPHPRMIKVEVNWPDGRWQGFKANHAEKPIMRWLVKLRPVRYKLVKRFEGFMEPWPDGTGMTVTKA